MQNQIDTVRRLIQEKRYSEARSILITLKHPKQREWLAKLDELERQEQQKSGASVSNPLTKTNKPLPLSYEEERKLWDGARPQSPKLLLAQPLPIIGGRAYLMTVLFGAKSAPLILNYFKLKQPRAGVFFMLIFIVLVLAWFPAFVLGLTLTSQLGKQGSTNIPMLIMCASVLFGLPFLPKLIARVQRPHFEQWARNYEQKRRETLAEK